MQVTAQRVAVLKAVSENPHVTVDVLTDAVRSVIGSISRQAIYDALGALVDRNLVRRIQPAGSAARYEGRVGDNHHHLICRVCDATFDVNCAVGARPCLIADDDQGFEIDEAEVIYWGRCPTCRTMTAAAAPGPGSLTERPATERPAKAPARSSRSTGPSTGKTADPG